MYASKRRQRNFKRVREPTKPGAATNPSKRHRERLNGELETVAALLPYDQGVISRLDKLSVLRLAVSYLQIKAHFQACLHRSPYIANFPFAFTHSYPYFQTSQNGQYGGIPSLVHSSTGHPYIDPKEHDFETMTLKALGGFIMILNENGDIYYASENIETYLGFHQSDILHQPLFEMIHSEDREDIRNQLTWSYNIPSHVTCLQELLTPGGMHYLERNVNARFRCLLDNTCGFLRIDIRGKLMSLHGLPHSYILGRSENYSTSGDIVLGLVVVCSPFVPPNVIDQPFEDPILKTKHALDLTLISTDSKIRSLLEINDKNLPHSFYALIHVDDAVCMAEAHKEGFLSYLDELCRNKNIIYLTAQSFQRFLIVNLVLKNSASGLLIYRLISLMSRRVYWIQSSCRVFYKNGKPESIGMTHRLLTEVEGTMLLDKRSSLKAKLLSFDDSLLQSPRNLQSTAALPSSSSNFKTAANTIYPVVQGSYFHSNACFRPIPQSSTQVQNSPTIQTQQLRGRKRRRSKAQAETANSSDAAPSTDNCCYPQITDYYSRKKDTQDFFYINPYMNASRVAPAARPSEVSTFNSGCCGVAGTSSSGLQSLLPLSQHLPAFGLAHYFPPENIHQVGQRFDQSNQWSSSRNNYWSSTSDFYAQNYPSSNGGYQSTPLTSVFCVRQFDDAPFPPSRKVEYPRVISSNLQSYTPPNQVLYTSVAQNQLVAPSEFNIAYSSVMEGSNRIAEYDVSTDHNATNYTGSDYKETLNQSSDYTAQNQMSTSNAQLAGFSLIAEVSNTLLS